MSFLDAISNCWGSLYRTRITIMRQIDSITCNEGLFINFLSLAEWIHNRELDTFRYWHLLKCKIQVSTWVLCTAQGRIKCLIGFIELSKSCLTSGVLHLMQNLSPYVYVFVTNTALRIKSGDIYFTQK